MRSKAGIFASLLYLAASPAPAQAPAVDLPAFFKEADVFYEAGFFLPAPADLWNRLLDRPVLVGKLWEAYRFSPTYRVSGTAFAVRAADDAGVEGELFLLERRASGRSYFGRGYFNHWAIPSFIAASVAVVTSFRQGPGGISGEVKIGLKGTNVLTELLLRLFSGVMTRRIDSRFRSNMADLARILGDIAADPQRPRLLLSGEALAEYDQVVLSPGAIGPSERRSCRQ